MTSDSVLSAVESIQNSGNTITTVMSTASVVRTISPAPGSLRCAVFFVVMLLPPYAS